MSDDRLETVEGAEAVEGLVRQAIGSWEEHAEAIARMAAMAAEMVAQAASAAAAMQRWWDQHGVDLADFLTALARFPQDHREVVAEYGAICTRLGWPPTMYFPWAFLAEFVKLAREGATDRGSPAG